MSEPEKPGDPAEAQEGPEPQPIENPEAALREAIGVRPESQRAPTPLPIDDPYGDEPVAKKPRRKTIVISAAVILAGLIVATLVFLGVSNSSRYLIQCKTDRISAERGRAFPPWGSRELSGAEWKPIALPPNAECRERETDDEVELAGWYLDLLVDRASTTLAARDLLEKIPLQADAKGAPSPLDGADAQLQQALLLARAPERRDQRKEVERLVGDVAYWRASLRLRDSAAALADAAKQFDAASAQRPRHATDASAWATFLRRVADELKAGPAGGPAPSSFPPQPEPHPTAPLGTALPVEPPPPDKPAAPPPVPIDAGLPTGGVLL